MEPLAYFGPKPTPHFSTFAILAFALAVVAGPIGGWVSNAVSWHYVWMFWMTRFLPDLLALILTTTAAHRIRSHKGTLKGRLFIVLAFLFIALWMVCGLASPM